MAYKKTPRALVITGFGLNCEKETTHAFEMAGAKAEKAHLNDILSGEVSLENYQMMAFIGGFSYGDHIAAGKVYAVKLKYRLADQIEKFIADGKLIIGICNGFQVMVKLGILPGFDGDYHTQKVTLFSNDSGVFYDGWVNLGLNADSPCVFTQGIEQMYLPVRHGEGKFIPADASIMRKLKKGSQIVMQYIDPETDKPAKKHPLNPNGSESAVAAICDPTGRIFGLMPHPEAFLAPWNHPHWTRLDLTEREAHKETGLRLFENGVRFARKHLL